MWGGYIVGPEPQAIHQAIEHRRFCVIYLIITRKLAAQKYIFD